MEYILNVRSFFALLYKEVSGKYILRFPHHGSRSFAAAQNDALPSVITQNGGRKRIFILFFCIIPPSQYPPSGFAGHLLINKEAYPIPILTVGTLS